jgi:plastocyanin
MRRLVLLLVFVNLGQAPAVKGGTVTGTVQAVQKGKVVEVDELYVYLTTARAPNSTGKGVEARIVQRKRNGEPEFSPEITVIPIGAKVLFPNADNEDHNVFSPAVKANNWFGFDLGKYGPDKKGRARDFLQVGDFDIYCDVHKSMWAKVKVVPTRYFTKVVGGKYTLTDVPPGTYTLVAWAPGSIETTTATSLEIEAGKSKSVESLNLQYKPPAHMHPRLDGSDYDRYPTR